MGIAHHAQTRPGYGWQIIPLPAKRLDDQAQRLAQQPRQHIIQAR